MQQDRDRLNSSARILATNAATDSDALRPHQVPLAELAARLEQAAQTVIKLTEQDATLPPSVDDAPPATR